MTKKASIGRIVVMLLTLSVLLLSTTARGARAQRAHDDVTIDFWIPLNDALTRSLLEPYFRQFEKLTPGVKVKYTFVVEDNNYVKYTTAIAAGRGPDVILTTGFNPPVPSWAANSFIQPLDPYFKQLGVTQDKFLPWIWNMQYFHGHVWGFVQEYDTTLFVWNKDAFKKAGLDPNKPPHTIAELDADAQKLTKFDAKGNLIQAGFIPWADQGTDPRFWTTMFGGRIYDAKQHKYVINSAANVRALQWIGKYAKLLGGAQKVDGFLKAFSGNADPLYTGQVAMKVVGDWVPPFNFKPYAPKNFHWGVAQAPTAPGVPYGTNIVIGSDTFVLVAGAKHPTEAAKLMLYMMRPAPVLAWSIGEANVPPTRESVFDTAFVKGAPFMSVTVDTARLALKNPAVLDPSPSSSIYDFMRPQLITAMQQVEFGRMSPQAALDGAQKLAEQHLATVKRAVPEWYNGGD